MSSVKTGKTEKYIFSLHICEETKRKRQPPFQSDKPFILTLEKGFECSEHTQTWPISLPAAETATRVSVSSFCHRIPAGGVGISLGPAQQGNSHWVMRS